MQRWSNLWILTHVVMLSGARAALWHGVLVGVKQRAGVYVPVGSLTVREACSRPWVLLLGVVEHGAGWVIGTHHTVVLPLILVEELNGKCVSPVYLHHLRDSNWQLLIETLISRYCFSTHFQRGYTVVGSIHTLKVGVINIFQPLSKFLIFGKSVRTSTLCMTQVIFPTIVYRQIISLTIHCITIPVVQTFTYTKLTVPLNSLGKFQKIMSWL